MAGRRRWSSDANWGKKEERKMDEQEKRAAAKKRRQPAKRKKKRREKTEALEERYTRARQLQRRAVAGFNADNVMCGGPKCVARMHEVLSFLEKDDVQASPPWN